MNAMPATTHAADVPMVAKPADSYSFGGLLRKKERWSLTPRGWALAVLVCLGLFVGVIRSIHPFLAVTAPTTADILVVEGWMPNYALEESIAEFRAKSYHQIVTVGCEILTGVNVEPGDNQAAYAAKRLVWLGLLREFVRAAPSPAKFRDRTFSSALALKAWSEANDVPMTSFNVVTLGPHARRSRLLFEKAFDGRARVGIISIEDREYDPAHWWRYSEGVKEVLSETAGYFYARFFFREEDRTREQSKS